ncbi:MAG TPA: G1 family glutamic endopeptidase [Xanthobacteraceae bacterium]|nr:G1 family glutamic endopeptidase [Xanthobacteraceae bacterium]
MPVETSAFRYSPYVAEIQQRVRTFEPPPADFDPLTATNSQLAQYGLPARPNPRTEPEFFQFWGLMLGSPLHVEIPEFPEKVPGTDDPPEDFLLHQLYQLGAGQRRDIRTRHSENSRNWSGAYITPHRPNRFVHIAGGWQVPEPSLPAVVPEDVQDEYRSSTWIGIGGQRAYPGSSLPQIGTSQFLTIGSSEPTIGVFWEWWVKGSVHPYPPVPILNFTKSAKRKIKADDEILASLTVQDGWNVLFHIKNQTTGLFVTFLVSPPSDPIVALGSTAEWIMERPTYFKKRDLYPLPRYTDIMFRYCLARSAPPSGGAVTNHKLDNARLIRMYEMFAAPHRLAFVSQAEKTSDAALRVFYREPGAQHSFAASRQTMLQSHESSLSD